MSKVFYSEEEYYKQRLRDFVSFGELGEGEIETHTIISSYPTEINDGPKEEPIGVKLKLPTFEVW